MFWIIAALLTAAVLIFLLRPLFRPIADTGIAPVEVYKAQLGEIDRDRAAGILSDPDAEAARTEIGRRVLRAQAGETSVAATRHGDVRWAAVAMVVTVVAITLAVYLNLGQPNLPAQPYALRDIGAESAAQGGPLIEELERRLATLEDPADQAVLIGDAFASVGGLDEAENSYRQALAIRPEDAEILLRLAEVSVMRTQGFVNESAAAYVDQALLVAPDHPAANYYRALNDFQQGRLEEAEDRLAAMLAAAPVDADWTGQVADLLSQIRTTVGEGAGIAALPDAERDAMIRSMVAQLAARLEAEPDDFDGWLRLANSYAVLGEGDAAQSALARARDLAAGEPVLEQRVEALAETIAPGD